MGRGRTGCVSVTAQLKQRDGMEELNECGRSGVPRESDTS